MPNTEPVTAFGISGAAFLLYDTMHLLALFYEPLIQRHAISLQQSADGFCFNCLE